MMRAVAIGFLFAAMAALAPVSAASLQVSPLSLSLAPNRPATMLSVRNGSTSEVAAEVRVFKWTQVDGRDSLLPATDVVASPPVIRAEPGRDFTVRILRLSQEPVSVEQAYRVIVTELPDLRQRKSGVALLVSQSMPLFVTPLEAMAPRLDVHARIAGNRGVVTATNGGGAHEKITGLRVAGAGGSVDFGNGLVGYVLAGGSLSVDRPVPKGFAGPLNVTGKTDSGSFDAKSSGER